MEIRKLDGAEIETKSVDELFAFFNTSADGLAIQEAQSRISVYGPNSVEEKKQNPLLYFLNFFWGPIPWMIEIAAILSAILKHWTDLIIIGVMLVFNAGIGFWQEHQASNALEALKRTLALDARCLRDKQWQKIPAADLVPGDVIRLRPGDIIPADVKLFGDGYLSVDQSALTGESLPVDKKSGSIGLSGSVVKQGEMVAIVAGTGSNTKFANTAKLVESAGSVSHFQKAVLHISDYLIYLSLGLATVLILAQLIRGVSFLTVFQFVLILVVSAIPVAMPAVLSMTMALGALALSKSKAIVTKLQSIEEIAGIDILCSDKTGTLTQNALTLGEPVLFAAQDKQALILNGALASKAENQDAIDLAIIGGLQDPNATKEYTQVDFMPFDPVGKRTESTVRDARNNTFKVTKGAPQVILGLCHVSDDDRQRADKSINDFATKGYRTLGVARKDAGTDTWTFLGIIPLYDPPREDSAETIARAEEHGIAVKMITGDNLAIAREIARQLKMKDAIQPADEILPPDADYEHIDPATASKIEAAEGFAQVFPEHKYAIVKSLQERGHLVAMTGDGVNDAPALKQADVGVAVSGATNAARAAASLVLTAPGLSVIIQSVEEARRIFERMSNYATYRITETIRIMFFVVLAMIVYNFYPITTIMIILLALLNDLPIMTIAYDNTLLSPKPVRWDMRRVLTVSTTLGLIGVVETFLLLIIAKNYLHLSQEQLQSFIYLKLAVAGHLTLLVVRTPNAFWKKPYPNPKLFWAIIGTQTVAALIVGLGIFVSPISWSYIGLVWAYCLVWFLIEDLVKHHLLHHLNLSGRRHREFIEKTSMPSI